MSTATPTFPTLQHSPTEAAIFLSDFFLCPRLARLPPSVPDTLGRLRSEPRAFRPSERSEELAEGLAFTVNASRTSSSPRFFVSFFSGLLCSWYHLTAAGIS